MQSFKKIVNLDFCDINKPESFLNRGAKCGDVKGIIDGIAGPMFEQREKLKSYKPTSYDASILDTLSDNHPVVKLKTYSGKIYNYPLSVLDLHVDMGSLNNLGLSQTEINQITGGLKIPPNSRKDIIDDIKDAVDKYLIEQNIASLSVGDRYNSDSYPNNFKLQDYISDTRLRFGRGTAIIQSDTKMLPILKSQELYKYSNKFSTDKKVRIAVIDTIFSSDKHIKERNNQLTRIKNHLAELGLEVTRATDLHSINEENPLQQRNLLQSGLNTLIKANPDIILIYLPENDKKRSDSDELSLYNTAKRICIGRGIPSQIIYKETISKSWTNKYRNQEIYSADDNIIMGILGKTGNIPYVLAKPIEYADIIVGLDVSHQKKTNAPGTMSFAAMSRIYTNEGALIGYRTSPNVSIPGEIIPREILESIFPPEEFSGKRVIVHRDGKFVGDELANIMEWGEIIDTTFYPIEITKSGVPRMYHRNENDEVLQVPNGTLFLLSEQEAYLASTPPPVGKKGAVSTSQPLRIKNYSDLSMDQAIYSVTALTLLHYGSTRSTRLPVSIHASDKIAGFLRRNITPQSTHGDVPFWL